MLDIVHFNASFAFASFAFASARSLACRSSNPTRCQRHAHATRTHADTAWSRHWQDAQKVSTAGYRDGSVIVIVLTVVVMA